MTLSEVTEKLGISEYPPELERIFENQCTVSICDKKTIHDIDEKYDILGKYKDKLYACLDAVKCNTALRKYGDAAVEYMIQSDFSNVSCIKLPTVTAGDSVLGFYPLLILMSLLPFGIKKFRERGFSEDEIYNALHPTFEPRIEMSERLNNAPGLDVQGYNWLRLYATAKVFPAGVFNITPKIYSEPIILLKNKANGHHVIVMTAGEYHKSGYPLGNPGFEDTEGSYRVKFYEDSDRIIGNVSKEKTVEKEPTEFSKKEWDIVLREGDGMAGIHIPRGADLSYERMNESFRLALKLAKERYPEINPKMIYCSSWMLDPQLPEILGEGSKITGFVNSFIKFPRKSSGKEIFNFVFPKIFESYETLPEDTSLQRKLKKLYIEGGHIFAYSGVIPM